jgi:hypothetical protein
MPADAAKGRAGYTAYDTNSTTNSATQELADSDTGTGGGVAGSLAQGPSVGPSVIKDGQVSLEVDRDGLQDATRDAISIAGRFGGFVLSTSSQDSSHSSSTVVVRVPAQRFEAALAALEGLGKVKTESISGQDVSQEFIDLDARLRNLRAQEAVMLRLMDDSTTISESIRVQSELQGITLEIERLTGRLRYLRDLTDMGTISVSMTEIGAPTAKPATGVLAKAWRQAAEIALSVVAAVIVGAGALAPVGIILAIAFLAFRALRPRLSS